MAKGVNKVIILGNVGGKETHGVVTKISVATNETWKDKDTGEKTQKTEWHKIVFFGRLAEIAAQYIEKGSQVYIEGRLQTSKYTAEDGSDRWSTDIIARELQLCGKKSGAAKEPSPPPDAYKEDAERYKNKDIDDCPF